MVHNLWTIRLVKIFRSCNLETSRQFDFLQNYGVLCKLCNLCEDWMASGIGWRHDIEMMINLISISTWTHFTNFWTLWFLAKVTKLWIDRIFNFHVTVRWLSAIWFRFLGKKFLEFQPLSGSPHCPDTARVSIQRVWFCRSTTIIFFRKNFKSMHINQNYDFDLNIKC